MAESDSEDRPAELSAEESHSITRMIGKLRSEQRRDFDDAAAAIWTRYFSDLLHLARRNLSPGVRQRADEDDLLQSVYNSFCLRQRGGQFELQDRGDLWSLLVQITRNKARNLASHHGRRRRNYRREIKPSEPSDSGSGEFDLLGTAATNQSPDDRLVFEEGLEQIKALDESLQKLALWKLAGYSNEEIASEKMMNCALRTVERKLKRIRDIWGVQGTEA